MWGGQGMRVVGTPILAERGGHGAFASTSSWSLFCVQPKSSRIPPGALSQQVSTRKTVYRRILWVADSLGAGSTSASTSTRWAQGTTGRRGGRFGLEFSWTSIGGQAVGGGHFQFVRQRSFSPPKRHRHQKPPPLHGCTEPPNPAADRRGSLLALSLAIVSHFGFCLASFIFAFLAPDLSLTAGWAVGPPSNDVLSSWMSLAGQGSGAGTRGRGRGWRGEPRRPLRVKSGSE